MGWETDKKWSDKFIPEIKSILGQHLISEAPVEEDRDHNTDLIVLTLKPFRVGCRVRRNMFLERYGHEFTMRSIRPSGQKTELQKMIEGWGDYFFYGFADATDTYIMKYFLGDLNVFREWFNYWRINSEDGKAPGIDYPNQDGSSYFRAFREIDQPNEFFIASNQP